MRAIELATTEKLDKANIVEASVINLAWVLIRYSAGIPTKYPILVLDTLI